MSTEGWTPTAAQKRDWDQRGYFLLPGCIDADLARELRGVIRNRVLDYTEGQRTDEIERGGRPGDDLEARLSRLRKLGNFCEQAPLIWWNVHAGMLTRVAEHFIGSDLMIKFNSCFLKPPLGGRETPWHQDSGLWRDNETAPMNFWLAVDPSTRENGCLQVMPGSHREPIHGHLEYAGGVHAELPREVVAEASCRYGIDYIELGPGDAIVWQSNLFHHSDVNSSPRSRIAVAGVYTSPAIQGDRYFFQEPIWVLQDGQPVTDWPLRRYDCSQLQKLPPPPFRRADGEVSAGASSY